MSAKDDSDRSKPSEIAAEKQLGLITFDLDDTLFRIGPVVADANDAMIEAMSKLGYRGITNKDVLAATRKIRKEISARNAVVTYTELRMRAIRTELERFLSGKIAVADTEEVVHDSVVQYIFNAWMRERNASASRRLFPDAISMLESIKSSHPNCVIGAVTNGRGNPLDMPETLGPHFDFCVSGEDDGVFPHRKPHRGIYDAALMKYEELTSCSGCPESDLVWVHVGDDLANDVGASAKCGAKAVWFVMPHTEDTASSLAGMKAATATQPSWSTASQEEVEKRKKMAVLARNSVSAKIEALGNLPYAVNSILCEP